MSAAIDSMSANISMIALENQLIKDEEYQKKLALVRAGSLVSFNAWAFLFGGFWFLYKKCHIIGWSLLAASLFAGLLFGTHLLAAIGFSVIAQIVLGLFGNAIYYSDIKRRARIAAMLDGQAREDFIEKNSGSGGAIVLVMVLGVVFAIPAVVIFLMIPGR